MDDGPAWLTVAATVAVDLGLAAMLGSLASIGWLRDGGSDWAAALARRSRRTLVAAAVFSAASMLALLALQTAAMADVPLSAITGPLGLVLGSTQIGHAGLAALACLLIATIAAVVGLRRAGGRATVVAGLGTLGFVCCRAAASHAAAHGVVSTAVAVEAAHLLLTGSWIGMVLTAARALAANPVGTDTRARADAARWIARLSTTATGVLVGVVLTGLVNAARGLASVSDLGTTGWGRLLVLKVALVAVAVLLGGLNRMVTMPLLLPALARPHAPAGALLARFVAVARIEALVLLAALVVAAWLAASAPGVAA